MKFRENGITASDNIRVINLIWVKIQEAFLTNTEAFSVFFNFDDFYTVIKESIVYKLKDDELLTFFEQVVLTAGVEGSELDLILSFCLGDDGYSYNTTDKFKNLSVNDQILYVYDVAPKLFVKIWNTKLGFVADDEELIDIELADKDNLDENKKLSIWYSKKAIKFAKLQAKYSSVLSKGNND